MSRKFTDIRNSLNKLAEINEKGAKEATDAAADNFNTARMITLVTLAIGAALIGLAGEPCLSVMQFANLPT